MSYYRDASADTGLDTPAPTDGLMTDRERIDRLLLAQQSLLRIIDDQQFEIRALKDHIGNLMFGNHSAPTEH